MRPVAARERRQLARAGGGAQRPAQVDLAAAVRAQPARADLRQVLRERDVDAALANISESVLDADGGTRIGAALQEFLATPRYADRARGALTIVLSDGLERGDPALMAHAVARLSRLSYRLLWWTPLATDPAYRPITRAMAAIQSDLDGLAGARDLATLLEQVQQL